MATPRPHKERTWTQADHEDNSRRIQKDADRRTWDRLGRLVGVSGRDLAAALGRMLDDRIAAALRTQETFLLTGLTDPANADAIRGVIVDLILDDLTELVTVLTRKESKHDARAKKAR